MQAPQTPCSQPTCAAGEAEIVAQEIDQRLAGLDPLADLLAVDAQPDLENAFGHRVPPKNAAKAASNKATAGQATSKDGNFVPQ